MSREITENDPSQNLAEASDQLKRLVETKAFPELQMPINRLCTAVENIISGNAEADGEAFAGLEKQVEELYRTSAAQANATPQKYQQPIFQCYSDYEKCAKHNKSKNGKALCLSLFVLSVARSLVSVSLTLKS